MPNINQRMAKGIIWMVAARLMDRSIGIVSTLILARLLVPGDFGLVAMATAIGGILDMLGAFSFDLALIQKSNAQDKHYNTVWTFSVIFGIVCAASLIALAGPAAAFYREARLTEVMYVLSLSYLINGFSNVGVINFRKELAFKSEFNLILMKRIITFFITISAAYTLRSYWALLIGMTAGRVAGTALSYIVCTYRPSFTLAGAKDLFHFSKWLLINNALYFLLNDGCIFVIGRLFGVAELGIYSVSSEIAKLPSTELIAPINRATFPGFSKMTSVQEMSASYLKVLGMISLLIIPVGIGIASVAESLVLVTLGDKWVGAIPLIQILAIYGAIGAVQGNNGTVWLALGKPRELTVNVIMFLCVLFPALYVFVTRFGIVGAGYAYLAALAPTAPYGFHLTRKLLGFKWSELLAVTWRPVLAASLMFLAVGFINPMLSTAAPLARLLCEAGIGAIVYSATILALWLLSGQPGGAEQFCLDRTNNALGRPRFR